MTQRAPGLGPFIVALIVTTIVVALAGLAAWHTVGAGSLAAGFPVAARTLFFFGDITFYLWVPFLAIATWRLKRPPRAWPTFLVALAGGILNVVVVALIGVVQEGGLASFVGIAVEASVATVLAAAVVVPLVYRRSAGRD